MLHSLQVSVALWKLSLNHWAEDFNEEVMIPSMGGPSFLGVI